MDISRLRTLREISLRGTMAEAADALCITPSAISQHIAHLEAEVGIPLVERRGRRIQLTHEGTRLAWYAERLISVLDEAMAEMAELKGETSGDLRIAAFSSVSTALIPATIKAVSKVHPKVRIILEELEAPAGLAALRAWTADLAIIDDLSIAISDVDDSVEVTPLIVDQLYAVVSKEHPLARSSTVRIEDLRTEQWAMDLANHAYSGVITSACRNAGFDPVINGFSSSLEVLLSLIKSGCSISLLPGLAFKHHDRELHILDLEPPIRRNIYVACRRAGRRHPAVSAVVTQLKLCAERYTLSMKTQPW